MNFDSDKFTFHNVNSRIPTPVSTFRRSASFRVPGDKANLSSSLPVPSAIDENKEFNGPGSWKRNFTPLSFNKSGNLNNLEDDLESIGSVTSNFSVSSMCGHPHFAKNGTTYSGKSHKYIVHCSSYSSEPEEYLTPTQRANRNIKRLKSLLQLAREKLREKENEILKLNKEVVELKLFKSSVEISNESPSIPEKELNDISDTDYSPNKDPTQGFNSTNDKYYELSPIKNFAEEDQNLAKMSPAFSQDGFVEKQSLTPDFLISSMADSGNFDDLPSSASLHSKDSVSFIATPELRQEQSAFLFDLSGNDAEEKIKIVRMYEKKLGDKKIEYEIELNRLISEQQQRNLNIIHEFEKKLKEEELKFESRWNNLLKATEEEKIMIVNQFEEKLEEERTKYRESLKHFKSGDGKVTDMVFEDTYSKKVEEEKMLYETSLIDIKKKFENEKSIIEKKFDDAMKAERMKFEESLKSIKEIGDNKVTELTQKVSELEAEYFELIPKYEKAVSRSEELEKENEFLKTSLKQQEECHRKVYLDFCKKGQETAKSEVEGQGEETSDSSSKKVSISELFAQLKITEVELENLKDKEYREAHSDSQGICLLSSKEAISLWMLAARKAMYKRLAEAQAQSAKKEKNGYDPETTLQFLKSAVYYFLTDRENHLGHLKAIESILAFSSSEKSNIEKLYLNKY